MKVGKNKVVEIIYELEVEGNIADKTTKDKPLDYIHGTGMLLSKFEENLENKEPGDKFQFTLSPAEGYGEYDPERVIDLPKEAFEVNGVIQEEYLQVGTMVPLMSNTGAIVPAKVLAVNEKTVKMDLNSQMAGKTLNFSGEILTVREATEKELKEGLHGEYVHSNCNCHGGCHEHGDGECCGHGEGHGDGECCGHGDGECCGHGEGHSEGHCDGHGKGHHGDGECCHGKGHGEGHCHKDE